jgi:tetratricopeptide (TPR) repeat protein
MKIAIPLGILVVILFAGSPATAAPDNLSDVDELVAVGRYYAAEKMLEAMTREIPEDKMEAKHAPVFAKLAEVRLDMPNPDLDGAEMAIKTALDLVEDKVGEYWKVLGRVSFARGDLALKARQSANTIKSWFSDAEVRFQEARKLDPKDPETLWMYGWAKELQEYPRKAREAYQQCMAEFPAEPGGYRRLGAMISNQANRTDGGQNEKADQIRRKALEVFDQGLEKAGPDAEIYYLRGLALEWAGKWDEAKESYRNAVRTDADLDKAWRRLLALKESDADLVKLAREILKKDRTNGTASMWLGYLLTKQGEVREAMDVMLPALKVHREHYSLWFQASNTAGTVYQSNNLTTKSQSIPWYEKIHEFYEFSGAAASNIGWYHRDVTRNYKESLKWYLAAVEREPNNQEIQNDTGLIYLFHFTGAEQKKALPFLEKTLALVMEDEQAPRQGFWDALENLCVYYTSVEPNPTKVIEYGTMRNRPYAGVSPYARSPKTPGLVARARKALGE